MEVIIYAIKVHCYRVMLFCYEVIDDVMYDVLFSLEEDVRKMRLESIGKLCLIMCRCRPMTFAESTSTNGVCFSILSPGRMAEGTMLEVHKYNY